MHVAEDKLCQLSRDALRDEHRKEADVRDVRAYTEEEYQMFLEP